MVRKLAMPLDRHDVQRQTPPERPSGGPLPVPISRTRSWAERFSDCVINATMYGWLIVWPQSISSAGRRRPRIARRAARTPRAGRGHRLQHGRRVDIATCQVPREHLVLRRRQMRGLNFSGVGILRNPNGHLAGPAMVPGVIGMAVTSTFLSAVLSPSLGRTIASAFRTVTPPSKSGRCSGLNSELRVEPNRAPCRRVRPSRQYTIGPAHQRYATRIGLNSLVRHDAERSLEKTISIESPARHFPDAPTDRVPAIRFGWRSEFMHLDVELNLRRSIQSCVSIQAAVYRPSYPAPEWTANRNSNSVSRGTSTSIRTRPSHG